MIIAAPNMSDTVTGSKILSLPEQDERYHALMELYPDMVCIQVGGNIAWINTAGAQLLGAKDPERLIGKPLTDLIHPAFRASATERFAHIGSNGRMPLTEEKWVSLDGSLLVVEMTAMALTYQGQPAIQIIARDITRRKRAEEMLHDSEERHRQLLEMYLDSIGVEGARTAELHAALRRAQEVDRLKSRFLSVFSHELRTPLTAIRGQTTTLIEYADQISPAEQLEALRIVDDEASRLDNIIGHVLDMSRIESGTLHVDSIAMDVQPVLQESIARLAAQAPHHTVAASLPPLPLAQADPRRVRQIMTNLLDNAIKFSPRGTTVMVDAEVGPTAITIHVRDQGPGIASEHLPHILDRFYRAEENSARVGGVGLGLAICKGLVEAMGGRLTVVSEIGQGSVFSFSLPRTRGVAQHGQE
jgi:PAS domain S-box-containing protein